MSELPQLDPVIHAQARLRVTVALAGLRAGDPITFPRLQQLLDMTAGTPVTLVRLTAAGRAAFESYTKALHRLLDATGGD